MLALPKIWRVYPAAGAAARIKRIDDEINDDSINPDLKFIFIYLRCGGGPFAARGDEGSVWL
jgi:hypothetical protein